MGWAQGIYPLTNSKLPKPVSTFNGVNLNSWGVNIKYFTDKYHGLLQGYTEHRAPPAPGGEVAHTRHAGHENLISQMQLERNNVSQSMLFPVKVRG